MKNLSNEWRGFSLYFKPLAIITSVLVPEDDTNSPKYGLI
jgi:hypothetical protein